jgi:hypothetical protein
MYAGPAGVTRQTNTDPGGTCGGDTAPLPGTRAGEGASFVRLRGCPVDGVEDPSHLLPFQSSEAALEEERRVPHSPLSLQVAQWSPLEKLVMK